MEPTKTFDVPGHPGEQITIYRRQGGLKYRLINKAMNPYRLTGYSGEGRALYEPELDPTGAWWEALKIGVCHQESSWTCRGKDKKILPRTPDVIDEDEEHAEAFLKLAQPVYLFIMQSDDPSAEGNAVASSETPDDGDNSERSTKPKAPRKA